MNKYLSLKQLILEGKKDDVHMALIHNLKIPCELMGTASNGHYNINLRLHILENIKYMHRDNSKNFNSMNITWNCPHHWIYSQNNY